MITSLVISIVVTYEVLQVCFSYVHLLIAMQGGLKGVVSATIEFKAPAVWKRREKPLVTHFFRFLR